MDENRNNAMNGTGGATPPMGGMNPPMGGMNPPMGGMNPQMGGMNPQMGGMNPQMGGMPPNMRPNMGAPGGVNQNGMGGMNRPPVGPNGAPGGGANPRANGSTSIVSVHGPQSDTDKKKKAKKPNIGPSIFAVLLFLLMAGGLFLGMLGNFWAPLSPSSLFLPEGVEQSNLLKGSLVGVAINGFGHINGYLNFSGGLAGVMGTLSHLLPAVGLLILAVSIVYALIAMLIAIFSRNNGKRALSIVSSCMFVGYGSCGFFTLIFGHADMSCLILAGIGLLVASLTALITNKQLGLVNVLLSLFSIGATVLFALAKSPLREYTVESTGLMPVLIGLIALGVIYISLLTTGARICAKKGKIFDLIIHILQFAVIVTVFVMAMMSTDPEYNLFAMFMPFVCSVGAPALALITVALGILIIFVPNIVKKAEAKKQKKSGANAAATDANAAATPDAADVQRPINPMPGYGAPAMAGMAPAGAQQPMRPPMPQPQQPGAQAQKPPMWQTPPPPFPQNRPPMRPQQRMDDEFSRGATSFKVPFSTGGVKTVVEKVVETDPKAQAEIDRLNAELRAMKEAQSQKPSTEIVTQEDPATKVALENLTIQLRAMQDAQARATNPNDPAILAALAHLAGEIRAIKQEPTTAAIEIMQDDTGTRAALDSLTAQLRAMQTAQAQSGNPNDPATMSAIAQLTAEIRAMKEAEAERMKAMEARLEAERKSQDDARIADAERIAAQARAEAERIAKEAEAKAEQARLEAAKQTEEERKKLEEERKKLEEERKAAEEARIAAERKAQEAREEAERIREEAEEARAAAERQVAEVRAAAERQAAVARAEAERKAAEAKAEADKQAAAAKAEADKQAAAAKAEADRKAEEDRKKLEEEKQKLEEERKRMEAARLEDERRRKEEMEQFKREMLEMKSAQPAPADPSKDENMAKIMEELRALKEAQANAGSNTSTTTYNYMQDDSNKEELSEFEKRMEELIRSQQKKEEPKPKRELTAFEKRMAELAARKAAAAANGETPKPAPKPEPKPAEPEVDEPLRYNCDAPDKFMDTLSNKEKNEFCDVFVADKLGVQSYLPAYKIGGDNKGFFSKVVIYLGKFRSQVSQPLLDKMIKYMRSPH